MSTLSCTDAQLGALRLTSLSSSARLETRHSGGPSFTLGHTEAQGGVVNWERHHLNPETRSLRPCSSGSESLPSCPRPQLK